jgi:hypothetical protein
VWKPSERSLVFPIACKGHRSGATRSHAQLTSAAAHVDGLRIGPWNETPVLVFSTELPLDGPLAVHALHAAGNGGRPPLPNSSGAAEIDLDQLIPQKNFFPGIERSKDKGRQFVPAPGCQVRQEYSEWFQRVLAQTDTAGLTAFAGAGRATARLLTKRQGSGFFKCPPAFANAAPGDRTRD